MTRSLLYGLTLVSAAAGAALWAASPGCEGSVCFGSGAKTTKGEQDRELASEVPGAGRILLGGSAQESAPAAASEVGLSSEDSQASWSEAEAPRELEKEEPDEAASAAEPELTSEDWRDRQTASTRRIAADGAADGELEAFGEPELSYEARKARQAAAAKAAKIWDSLTEAALGEPDDELRGEAINGVGLHRGAESVAVLNEVAAFDPSPDNRLQAIQQLWYSAADGLDSDGGIRNTLQAALDDPDEAIAKMAEQALADLQALEESRAVD